MSEEEFVARLSNPQSWSDPAFRQFRRWLIESMDRIEGMAYVEPSAWLGRVIIQAPKIGDELVVLKAEVDAWVSKTFGDEGPAVIERWLAKGFAAVSITDLPGTPDVQCYRIKTRYLVR